VEQSLRCPAVAAVWAAVERLDTRWFRRLQLAAEEGGTLGLLLRPWRTRGQPSWADVQLAVIPCRTWRDRDGAAENWRLRVEITRCRGAVAGRAVELEMEATSGTIREACEHEAHGLSLAPPLAHSALDCREARA
jgi:protein ImuA